MAGLDKQEKRADFLRYRQHICTLMEKGKKKKGRALKKKKRHQTMSKEKPKTAIKEKKQRLVIDNKNCKKRTETI